MQVVHSDSSESSRANQDGLVIDQIKIALKPNETNDDRQKIHPKLERNPKEPFAGVNFNFDNIFNSKGKIIRTRESNIFNSNTPVKQVLQLNQGEYIHITQSDKKNYLFNGALIIRFIKVPDLNGFAEFNDLELITNLSDINAGVFKVKNILDIKINIENLGKDQNILSIDLDTIDPTIKPK